MSEIPEVFAIFEQKLAHVLSFTLREKGQKKAIEELLVYFSGIVERASTAENRVAELEAELRMANDQMLAFATRFAKKEKQIEEARKVLFWVDDAQKARIRAMDILDGREVD